MSALLPIKICTTNIDVEPKMFDKTINIPYDLQKAKFFSFQLNQIKSPEIYTIDAYVDFNY